MAQQSANQTYVSSVPNCIACVVVSFIAYRQLALQSNVFANNNVYGGSFRISDGLVGINIARVYQTTEVPLAVWVTKGI